MSAPAPSRSTDSFDDIWSSRAGVLGFFSAVQHKTVGARYMVTAFILFLIGGLQALFMRVQLSQAENSFLSAETYNQLFTMHGTTMMFLFAVPFLEGLASYLLPLMIGCRDLPFPRYNAFNYWCYLLGGLILYSSYLFALVPDAGWFAYVPLSGPEFSDKAMDFWLFGLTLAELAAIGAAIEIGVAVLRNRAPGMSLNRMPIFAWTMLAVSFMIIVAFIPLLVASVLLELDRTVGTAFFDTEVGGNPLLWQHLFWIFGHPEVYVMFLPGAAIISHIIPVHSKHPLAAYPLVVVAIASTAVMSLGLWVHHMYTTGLPGLTLSFFTAASMSITLASGLQVFAWIVTLWLGKPRFTVPMLFALGFLVTFVAGGITGVMVASVAFDEQVHDTYFVVAHFHYVLIGGMLFPVFAALHHWWAKFTGKEYSTVAGHVSFWLVFVGFHTTFFPMHLTGLWGMPRRVYTYERELDLDTVNLLSTVGAFILAGGVLVLTVNLVHSRFRGRAAAADPWGGDSLEWQTASPPTSENFPSIPVVTSRHPGWDPEGEYKHRDAVDAAFGRAPTAVRASPMTSVITATPDGAMLLPGPTVWPIVPAAGFAVIAVSMLGQWYVFSFVGIAIALVGFAGWAWRNEQEHRQQPLAPLEGMFRFEAPGPRAIGWWAATGAGVIFLVGMGTLAASALFLQVNTSVWPLETTVDRPVLFTLITLALVASAAAAWWGARHGGDEVRPSEPALRRAHLLAAGLSLAAGVVAAVLLAIAWFGSDLDPRAHAYASSAWTMLAAQTLMTVVVLGITGLALLSRLRQDHDGRPAILLQNAAIVWGCTLVGWGAVWITTDVLPALVI